MSGQEGIDRLLQAEQEATEIVAKARKGELIIQSLRIYTNTAYPEFFSPWEA
jgi:hypothetical protein